MRRGLCHAPWQANRRGNVAAGDGSAAAAAAGWAWEVAIERACAAAALPVGENF